ncbi:hypothetical protein D6D08_02679 [Aureobasidium pullulans]|nr:hypothetical protein D6D08_02679 [Aureobasidium pullulans]
MKRKRDSKDTSDSIKRTKASAQQGPDHDHQSAPSILRLYYPQVLTLREYLLQATTSKHKKRRITNYGSGTGSSSQDADARFVNLLDTVLVGFHTVKKEESDLVDYQNELSIFSTQVTGSEAKSSGSQPVLPFAEIVDCSVNILQDIYRLVEKVIAKAVPLWDQVLSHTGGGPYEHNGIKRSREFVRPFKPRVEINDFRHEWLYGEYRPTGWTLGRLPETAEEKAELQSCADVFDYRNWEKRHKDESLEREQGVDVDELEEWWRENMRVLHMPEPKPYAPREIPEEPPLDLRKEYADSGLQIIVKLANTYLPPDDPEWEGGSWHVEGLSNEHIVATAIYYFSNTNITPSHLKFRQNGSDESWFDMEYEQGDYAHLEKITGFINDQDNLVQSLGSVLCKEGRLLAFPNVLQHNVGSFKLENSTKPGERKILALFLVDPHVRILSTSKVPPQQKHWWEKDLREKREGVEKLNTLPNELMEKVFEDVRDFPISMDEAKEIREALMEERGPIGESMIECEAQFFFCEH